MDINDPRMAMNLGLLSAGAGMLDPRGTYGSTGAAISRGIQQGLSTYLPIMQFQERRKERQKDREFQQKQQDVMNRFRKNQETFEAARLELMRENYEKQGNRQNRQLRLMEDKAEREAANLKAQTDFISQWMAPPPGAGEARTSEASMAPYQRSPRQAQLGAAALGMTPLAGVLGQMAQGQTPTTKQRDVAYLTGQGYDEQTALNAVYGGLTPTTRPDPMGINWIQFAPTGQPMGRLDVQNLPVIPWNAPPGTTQMQPDFMYDEKGNLVRR